jgi:hypothetical protein
MHEVPTYLTWCLICLRANIKPAFKGEDVYVSSAVRMFYIPNYSTDFDQIATYSYNRYNLWGGFTTFLMSVVGPPLPRFHITKCEDSELVQKHRSAANTNSKQRIRAIAWNKNFVKIWNFLQN